MAMEGEAPRILVLENRQLIAEILCDLLRESGFYPLLAVSLDQAVQALRKDPSEIVLADLGWLQKAPQEARNSLEEAVRNTRVPVVYFSCSPLPEAEGVPLLRSPGDFATVVDAVWQAVRRKRWPLGMVLVEMGAIQLQELETVLRIQKELAGIGRKFLLGQLLVRLGFVAEEVVEKALHLQELRYAGPDDRGGVGAGSP